MTLISAPSTAGKVTIDTEACTLTVEPPAGTGEPCHLSGDDAYRLGLALTAAAWPARNREHAERLRGT